MIEGSQYTIRFMVHNIYFHDSPLESNRELIDYLNYVFHNIEYDIPNAQSQKSRQELFKMDREKRTLFDVDEDGYTTFWDKRYLGLHIHLSSDVCSVLGLTNHILEEDHSENLQGLLATNFRMFNLQDSQVFTRDANVQHILNMNWIGKQKYFYPAMVFGPIDIANLRNQFNRIRIIMGKFGCTQIRTSSSCSSERKQDHQ